jgi:hypothetical protein
MATIAASDSLDTASDVELSLVQMDTVGINGAMTQSWVSWQGFSAWLC